MADEAVGVTASSDTQTSTDVPSNVTAVTVHFKLIFIGVLATTLVALAMNVAIGVLVKDPTDAANSAADTCSMIATMGFGAIVGLLGGRAA